MGINATGLTMGDIARRLGGDQVPLVDALTNPNAGVFMGRIPMRQIVGWVEPFERIVGRPTVAFRRLGGYVSSSKGERTPFSEGVFMISGVSEVDKQRADRDPRGALMLRQEEDLAYLESIGYNMSLQTFYGGTSLCSTAEGYDGFCTRCNSGMSTYIQNTAGSIGDSIYAFRLGPGKLMGIYNVGPDGKLIQATDYGAILDKKVSSASDNVNEFYKTMFNAVFGIAQYHAKSVGRISGIGHSAANNVAAGDFINLYAAMEGKPDLLVTTWRGWGSLSTLLAGKQVYAPGQTDYAPYIGSYDGIPVIVDSCLMADSYM